MKTIPRKELMKAINELIEDRIMEYIYGEDVLVELTERLTEEHEDFMDNVPAVERLVFPALKKIIDRKVHNLKMGVRS